MTSTSPVPRRRAGLLQERSRQTRRRLVRAALHLWSERGFENGVEQTSVEEIAQAAGVTKGTFYFHFARKEEILLEMGVETAALLNEAADRGIAAGAGLADALRATLDALAGRMNATPPAAVGRALTEFRRPRTDAALSYTGPSFADAFEKLFARAQRAGEVTDRLEVAEMAQALEALVVDALVEWSEGNVDRLGDLLGRRAAIVLAGLHPGSTLAV